MGRIRELERTSGRKQRNPVVYLVCEGSETEIRYFKKFRSRGCHIDIVPIPSQYKSADKLVQKARATLGSSPYYPEDGDVIWCVFDRDENTNQMLDKAFRVAEKEGYRIAYSNPSFEIWFLYHFVNQTAEVVDCQAAVTLLKQKGRLEQYEKNKNVYERLKPMQSVAIARTKQRRIALESEHCTIIARQSNPVTTVFELVEFLKKKQ